MKVNGKFLAALLLLIVAGVIFILTGYQTNDVPYMLMGVGMIVAAFVIAISGRGNGDGQ